MLDCVISNGGRFYVQEITIISDRNCIQYFNVIRYKELTWLCQMKFLFLHIVIILMLLKIMW